MAKFGEDAIVQATIKPKTFMQVLLAVVEDLYTFAVSMLFPRRPGLQNSQTPLYLPASRVVSPIREVIDIQVYPDGTGKQGMLPEEAVNSPDQREMRSENLDSIGIAVSDGAVTAPSLPQKNSIAYCAHSQVSLRSTPDDAADTAIALLAYGDMVMILEMAGDYAYVAAGNRKGYVPTAMLVQEAAGVYPAFVIGTENSAWESNTVRLRGVIRDEFSANLSQLPLQAHEYVYYKLLRRGTRIAWPDVRPRTPGSWAKILSTLEGVSVGDAPSVGAVMEFTLPEGAGEGKAHLAYVEKVYPDQAIQISEADYPDRGIYNERTLTADEWRALKPVFITIS